MQSSMEIADRERGSRGKGGGAMRLGLKFRRLEKGGKKDVMAMLGNSSGKRNKLPHLNFRTVEKEKSKA